MADEPAHVDSMEFHEDIVDPEGHVSPVPCDTPPSAKIPKACHFMCHADAVETFPLLVDNWISTKNTRLIKGRLRSWLVDQVPKLADESWICGSCIEFAQLKANGESTEDWLSNQQDGLVKQIVQLVRSGRLKRTNLVALAEALGALCVNEITEMVKVTESHTNEFITAPYGQVWKTNNLVILKSFLESATAVRNKSSIQQKESRARHLIKAVDNLALSISPRFINPSALCESIVMHSVTGSRFACDLFAKSNASGGHTHMTKVIESVASSPPLFPKGDIYVAFDNQQIVGREYRVRAGGGQRTSMTTTICVYKEELECNVQSTFLINSELPIPSSDPSVLWSKFQVQKELNGAIHRHHRLQWLTTRLCAVAAEFDANQGNLEDPALTSMICSPEYEKGVHYDRVDFKPSSCTVTDIESLMVNPNSFVTITKVLDKLLEMNEASDPTRKWFCVYCDGLPHGIAWKIIQSTYHCAICKTTGTKSGLEDHDCRNKNITRKYEKIILRPGAGHIEVNLVRMIFHEYFDVFISAVAKRLGYSTPRSLDYCKSALDHHKSWQILQIIYISLTDELLHLFCTSYTGIHNVENFQNWLPTQANPNIQFAFDFVFNVLHPLFLFRSAIRQCNDKVAYAALYRCAPFFYGFNHPKYRELVARELFFQLTLPSIGSPLASRLGFRMKKSNFGQGLDFLLEERNKQQKQWVFATGAPTEEQWRRASSSLTLFESIKENVLNNVGMARDSARSKMGLGHEYIMARRHFRLVLANPLPILSTFDEDPVAVNPKFANASKFSMENMEQYFRKYLIGKKCPLSVVSATRLQQLSIEEMLKTVKKLTRQIPAGMRGDLEDRIRSGLEHEEVVELLGDVEDIFHSLDCAFSSSN